MKKEYKKVVDKYEAWNQQAEYVDAQMRDLKRSFEDEIEDLTIAHTLTDEQARIVHMMYEQARMGPQQKTYHDMVLERKANLEEEVLLIDKVLD